MSILPEVQFRPDSSVHNSDKHLWVYTFRCQFLLAAIFGQAAHAWKLLSEEQRKAFTAAFSRNPDDPELNNVPMPSGGEVLAPPLGASPSAPVASPSAPTQVKLLNPLYP